MGPMQGTPRFTEEQLLRLSLEIRVGGHQQKGGGRNFQGSGAVCTNAWGSNSPG